MPKCEFSETQYTFGYIFEFLQNYIPWTTVFPFFPSTRMEGDPGFGYDVKINQNIFLQFKIPFYVTRRNSQTLNQWDTHNSTYFRININTDDNQFKQLKELQSLNNDHEVFYCAPEFNKQNEFKNHFLDRTIVDSSALFSINDLPNYRSGKHFMTYKPNSTIGFMFSKPKKIKKHKLKSIIDKNNDKELSLIKELASLIKFFNLEVSKLNNKKDDLYKMFYYVQLVIYSEFKVIWLPIFRNQAAVANNRYT